MLARWAEQFTALISRFNPVELYTNGMSQAQQDTSHQDPRWPFSADPRRDRFPFDAEDFLSDQDAFNEAEIMRNVRIQLS